MDSTSERDNTSTLILSAQQGNSSALEELFARYTPLVSRMVALRLGVPAVDIHAHEDLVQEALLSAIRSLDTFEYRGEGSFRNWMAGIVTNRIRDDVRRRRALKRHPTLDRPAPGSASDRQIWSGLRDPDSSPSERAMRHELAERIEQALLGLGERYRRVYELRRIAEMPYDQIAEEMGLSGAASARAMFARTLSKIADAVGDAE
jgi:RNA polymerase sigma-70 factor, ECF subfamily